MRKWIALPIGLALCAGLVYLFFPAKVSLNEQAVLPVNSKAFTRVFFDEKTWTQWWPGGANDGATASSYRYNGRRYRLSQKRFSSFLISIGDGADTVLTELFVVPTKRAEVRLSWMTVLPAGANPVRRLQQYFKAKSLRTDMQSLLEKLKQHYADADNFYGLRVEEASVKDSLLISTSRTDAAPLLPDGVYALIDRLKAYAQKTGAQPTGAPMLNVLKEEDGRYLTRVALPVNKRLPGEGDIVYKRMLGNGNILVAEVKGGPSRIEEAFAQLQNFVYDYDRIAPAIPFQSLITDRRAERDTAKWITKLYWPVM